MHAKTRGAVETPPTGSSHEAGQAGLRRYLRPVPVVRTYESAARAASTLAQLPIAALPVVDAAGRLAGEITAGALTHFLATDSGTEHSAADVMRPPRAVAPAWTSPEEARRRLAEAGAEIAYVTDGNGQLLGCLLWQDLFGQVELPLQVPNPGGMATPFGIHLSAGGVRSGVRSAHLVMGGAVLGLMIAVAYAGVGLLAALADRAFGTGLWSIWTRLDPPPGTGAAFIWLGLQGLAALLFLVILRVSPLPGYHGAEHQVAHALEMGESLDEASVARMPRVHPRCGTNVAAGAALFIAVAAAWTALSPWRTDALVGAAIGAMLALRNWRRLGSWLQEHVTTRAPRAHQLRQAIEAGRELRRKYAASGCGSEPRWRRLWNSGVPQIALGVFLALSAAALSLDALGRFLFQQGYGGMRLW